MREKQDYKMYNNKGIYDHKGRWISYYYQYSTVKKLGVEKILEVGIGNGTTSTYLKKVGFSVTTADYEENLGANVIADVTKLPFIDNQFDMSICCEVLEHLPFTEFKKALTELSRVSNNYVFITVPDHRRVLFSGTIKLPFITEFSWSFRFPTLREHKFDGFHYWEIGHNRFGLDVVKKEILDAGLKIKEHGSPADCPMIHYFLISKN